MKRLVCFITAVLSFFTTRLDAYGYEREITLFPSHDIQLYENTEKTKTIRLGATESAVNPKILPCLLIINQIPLLYSVLQVGAHCAFKTSNLNNMGFSIVPETDTSTDNGKKGYALGLGVSENFDLTNGKRSWLATGSFNYKFWDNQLIDSSYNLSSKQLLQIWGNVFDSNLNIGLLRNSSRENDSNYTAFSLYMYYLQSVPLEWRQMGGARETASLEYKAIGVSFRKEVFQTLVFGLGIAYWTVTFDGIRISGPLPDAYFALDF